jgi:creatinine amidohydrolase/Fe(II)-dependent formamide hydrolase-like protein
MDPLSMPHGAAREALATGAPVFLCTDPVEYHGPHLSLHNDALIGRGLAGALHARLARHRPEWPLLVTANLEVGVEPVPGLGSRGTPLPRAKELIRAACRSLVELGARRVVLTTFHGSPFHAIALEAGAELLREAGVPSIQPLNAVLTAFGSADAREYEDVYATVDDPADRARVMADLPFDLHGGFTETSLALYLAPESVSPRWRQVPPCPPVRPDPLFDRAARAAASAGKAALAAELATMAFFAGWLRLRPFPGYTSSPHLATAEAGRRLLDRVLDRLEPLVLDVLEGRAAPPPPIMGWVAAATLDGRLLPYLPVGSAPPAAS